MCEIEAKDLNDITKIIVGQKGSGDGEGWYLESVTLKVPITVDVDLDDENSKDHNNEKQINYTEYCFKCNR